MFRINAVVSILFQHTDVNKSYYYAFRAFAGGKSEKIHQLLHIRVYVKKATFKPKNKPLFLEKWLISLRISDFFYEVA